MKQGLRLGLVAVALLIFGSSAAWALEPVRNGQESSLIRAAFVDGRLWMLSDAGEISVAMPDNPHRKSVDLPEPAYDLCRRDGVITVVTGARESPQSWTIRRWEHSAWSTIVTIPTAGARRTTLDCS